MSEEPKSIREQARGIERDCERAAIRDALVSASWDSRNLRLGLLSAITAAVAAFVAGNGQDLLAATKPLLAIPLETEKPLIVLFALASAALSSALTFLAPSKKAESFQESSNKYHALRERLRMFINSAPNEETPAEDEKALQDFIREKHDIDVNHPIIPEWAYRKAHDRVLQKRIRNRHLKWLENELAKSDYTPPQTWWEQLKFQFGFYRQLSAWKTVDQSALRESHSDHSRPASA